MKIKKMKNSKTTKKKWELKMKDLLFGKFGNSIIPENQVFGL
jgi:hypothetical protein